LAERRFIFLSPEQLSERWDPDFYLSDFNDAGDTRMKLGDLVNLRKQNPLKRPDPYFKYIEISSLDAELGEIVKHREVRREELPARARYWAWKGDLLVGLIRPERGAVAIVPEELDGCAVSSALAVLETKNVEPEYVYFLLRSKKMRSLISRKAKGQTIPTLGVNDLLSLPVPPLKRAEVHALLAELKMIKEGLKVSLEEVRSIPQFIEDTIASVLPAFKIEKKGRAFTVDYPKLNVERFDVAYYAPDYRSLNEALLKAGRPVVALGDLAKDMEVGTSAKIESEGVIPILRNVNIQADGTIDGNRIYVKPQSKMARVKPDSLLLSLAGSNVGTVAVAPESITGHAYNQSLVCFCLRPEVNPWYFTLFMNSSYGKKQVERLQFVSGRPYLTLSSLNKIKIPLLPLEQQNRIANKAMQVINERKEKRLYWLQRNETIEKKLWGEL